ncbi:tRNA (adenosine(37)-N6)-threonylcarbamoyltransferase complex ATPase subunit type 1 TsaE [Moraxella bovis]|uniref:tRNA threonylcarbamoyladenosine biosynthesis protein TsaE n=1 Tax=Moraxella bovis TaxID=476 RepID=A0A1T0A4Z5_MORBO|nr:tRNA (adenosine(37)-N6)-threonylcarbamoyltransferase complex ATPase subunit type 1 TsaE [Moraxella bovis]OOR90767.1 tRNA (adenosine(37)-N6)-threonylcarbamoyltransferase complex ATPase subunit type 1 TsaE [Moraxella bovis]STY93887.1 ADP-binding protein [Moraxella bovis]
MKTLILKNETDTQHLANALAKTNPTGSLWLSGDLGAGKTTFTRYLLRALGHTGAVKSPTYTLVEPYNINGKPVYHADLYRLNDPEELDFIGFFEYFDEPNSLVIIEWASRAESILPKPDITINITRQADESRVVEIVGMDLDLS